VRKRRSQAGLYQLESDGRYVYVGHAENLNTHILEVAEMKLRELPIMSDLNILRHRGFQIGIAHALNCQPADVMTSKRILAEKKLRC